MRRVVSSASPVEKIDLVLVHRELELLALLRDPGQLAERSRRHDRLELRHRSLDLGLLDREPVGVGRGHHELARLEAHQDAGQHRPRLVTRSRAADPRDRGQHRLAVDLVPLGGLGLRQPRKVLGVVGVQPVGRRPGANLDRGFLGLVLDRRPRRRAAGAPGRAAAGRVRRPTPRSRPVTSIEVRSESSMSVAASSSFPPDGVQQDPGEDLHGRPRRDTARDDPERPGQLVPRAGDVERSLCDHSFCFHHL